MLPKTMKSFFFLPSSFISDSVCGLRARRKDERMQQLLVLLAPKLLILVSKSSSLSLFVCNIPAIPAHDDELIMELRY
jgi:hypothetical protein